MILTELKRDGEIIKPQLFQCEDHLVHCGPEERTNTGGIHNLQRSSKGGQETNAADTVKVIMDIRGNLKVIII